MSEMNQRISGIDRRRSCYIMLADLPIALLTEESNSKTGERDWVFEPIYENCDILDRRGEIVDIGGIDLDLRLPQYIRRGTPYFVHQRILPECRSDLKPMLEKLQMKEYDHFEFICRRHGVCSEDTLYVSRRPDDVINPRAKRFPYDIPDHDTSMDGWL